jgi:soluble lytic murein transglycosylase-like protein
LPIPSVMGKLSTGAVGNLLVPVFLLAMTALGQTGSTTAASGAPGQVEQAPASMQQSLAQQQAALDAFRENAQASSVREQRESISKQMAPLQSHAPAPLATAPAATLPSKEVSGPKPVEFFTFEWPGTLPLSMPNVQMINESCSALGSDEVNKLVQTAADKHGLRPELLRSVMKQESAFKPCALSSAGAMGLMQIMPETADLLRLEDPYDPASNIDAGAKFLKMMLDRFSGDVPLALAAYNAGPGAVDKAGGIPPIAETLQYLSNILGDLPIAY